MAQRCGNCNEVAYKLRFMPTIKKSLGYGPGTCRCAEIYLCQRGAIPSSTANPFNITFDHVSEFGAKLHVNNLRELESAEKRLGFQSVVLNSDAQNFDDPVQQRKVDMAAVHKWKYSNEGRYRDLHERRR